MWVQWKVTALIFVFGYRAPLSVLTCSSRQQYWLNCAMYWRLECLKFNLARLLLYDLNCDILIFRFADHPGCPFLWHLCQIWQVQQWGKGPCSSVYSKAWTEHRLWWWLCQTFLVRSGSDRYAWRHGIRYHVWWALEIVFWNDMI